MTPVQWSINYQPGKDTANKPCDSDTLAQHIGSDTKAEPAVRMQDNSKKEPQSNINQTCRWIKKTSKNNNPAGLLGNRKYKPCFRAIGRLTLPLTVAPQVNLGG
jgi:hypothetical protein